MSRPTQGVSALAGIARLPQRLHRAPGTLARATGLLDRASSLICGLAVGTLVLLLLASLAGYRQLIDHSDSMRPAIRAGDLLITRAEPISTIRPGNIVSFTDPSLHGRLITHRVVALHSTGPRIDVRTRGDANAAPESWSVTRQASVGKLVVRIPAIGRALSWFAAPWTRTILLSTTALLLSVAALRRIWKP